MTVGLEISMRTPRLAGPGARHQGTQPCDSQRSIRIESGRNDIRARVARITAPCRPTAIAVVTSRAARSVANQSISRLARGTQNAKRMPAMQVTTTSSSSVNPLGIPPL